MAKTLEAETRVIADQVTTVKAVREQVIKQVGKPVTPGKKNSVVGNDDIDWHLCEYRYLVKNKLARLKQFSGINIFLTNFCEILRTQQH